MDALVIFVIMGIISFIILLKGVLNDDESDS